MNQGSEVLRLTHIMYDKNKFKKNKQTGYLISRCSPTMLTGSFRDAAVTMEAHTVAAPPMSALIASIEAEGFREMPPLQTENRKDSTVWCNEKVQ